MEYHKALKIIKLSLIKKGLKIEEETDDLRIEGVCLDMTTERWAFHNDWTTSNLHLKTIECDINYKNKRKRIIGFNIVTGDYDKLITKIKDLQQENIKIKKENEEEKNQKEKNKEIVKKIFKGYDFKLNYGTIEIETPYFGISIYPNSNNVKIQANVDLNYTQTIELLTKLGIERRK